MIIIINEYSWILARDPSRCGDKVGPQNLPITYQMELEQKNKKLSEALTFPCFLPDTLCTTSWIQGNLQSKSSSFYPSKK
jgi:hypothetical protein